MTDFTTEEQFKLRPVPGGLITHLIDTCPSCGSFNFWTKYREIMGEMYYYRRCGSCGFEEA